MLRIAGVNIPDNKRVEISLTYIYGVGKNTASDILAELKINKDKRVKDLTEEEQNSIRSYVEKKVKVEGDLNERNIRKQFDYANSLDIPWVIVVGEKEEKAKKRELNNLKPKRKKLTRECQAPKKLKSLR